MTIRVGANPAADQMYVGIQSGAYASNVIANAALSIPLGVTGTAQRRNYATATLSLPAPVLTLVPIHPVRRRGPGALALGKIGATGTATRIGHVHADGTLTLRPSLIGSARLRRPASGDLTLGFRVVGIGELQGSGQRIASGDLVFEPLSVSGDATVHQYIPASGDLTLVIALAGAGLRHAYITGSGDLVLGPLSVKSGELGVTAQVIPMEGVFADRILEGAFVDTIRIEGNAS